MEGCLPGCSGQQPVQTLGHAVVSRIPPNPPCVPPCIPCTVPEPHLHPPFILESPSLECTHPFSYHAVKPCNTHSHPALTPCTAMPQALLDLQGVMVPQHLQTNRTAQAALAGRYRVRMSSFAAELLMRFLHASRMQLLLSLTNEYIELDVRTRLPRTCYPTSEV